MVRIDVQDAARRLDHLLDQIKQTGEGVELAREGEVVARLMPPDPTPAVFDAHALTELFRRLPDLGDDAAAFADGVESARQALLPARDPWQD